MHCASLPSAEGESQHTWKCGCEGRADPRVLVTRSISQGSVLGEGGAGGTINLCLPSRTGLPSLACLRLPHWSVGFAASLSFPPGLSLEDDQPQPRILLSQPTRGECGRGGVEEVSVKAPTGGEERVHFSLKRQVVLAGTPRGVKETRRGVEVHGTLAARAGASAGQAYL